MIKCTHSLLRIAISLLLVFCAHPIAKECAHDTIQSIENISSAAYFAPVILKSTTGIINFTIKESHNSSNKSFHHAVILDQLFTKLTQPLFSFLLDAADRFSNKIRLDATATRAPPIFIF